MKLEILTKGYNLHKDLKELIEKKVQKLSKYFDDTANATIHCKQEGKLSKFEVTIKGTGVFFRAEAVSDDMSSNLDEALTRIERQVIKYSDKSESKIKRLTLAPQDLLFFKEIPTFEDERIVKHKTYELTPISVDEAMQTLDNLGNTFYVFLNKETKNVNVLYRRLDGNFGLIEAIH
ncbi:MAG: ribosome-associated translation inhibitor RaiA [Christensenellaceae bacterium]|jgi:putative sigma-54 modulation protein|nr:ribosome-associated translation inhibitor RaiA [Christensenellaceae bacterium]